MKFIFAPPDATEFGSLLQGDLLVRNTNLQTVLGQAHGYYASAPDYTHFIVLTQSCDLVRRRKAPKSRYITLAAARPLSVVVDRFIQKHRFDFPFPITVCDKTREIAARQLLERLIHNTEDGYFFIKSDSHPRLTEDLCAFLALSVTVRSDQYDQILSAKIAQLDHIFSAKLGWLVGSLYSRIGTPDVEDRIDNPEQYKERFYEEALFSRTAWLSGPQLQYLKQLKNQWQKAHPGADVTEDAARGLLEQIPTEHELVVTRILSLLENAAVLQRGSEFSEKAKNVLLSDATLRKMTHLGI